MTLRVLTLSTLFPDMVRPNFGVFVELEEGIEGLVHISEISQKRVKSSSDLFAVGDTISAVIKNLDLKSRKIRLSVKDLEGPSSEEAPSVHAYLNNRENVGSNLGKALADVKIADIKGS